MEMLRQLCCEATQSGWLRCFAKKLTKTNYVAALLRKQYKADELG
jgi:hypothetical protein